MLLAKKLLYFQNFYPKLFTTAGERYVVLNPGTYEIVLRGGGGAGGEYGGAVEGTRQPGGAGGKGLLVSQTVTVTDTISILVSVGAGGLTASQGGNGGAAGASSGIGAASAGGAGGGGGRPSYVSCSAFVIGALGGGGGGGAGGNAVNHQARYEGGSGSGGGGGFYRFNNGTITSVPGQNGKKGAGYWERGVDGATGNTTDFPSITSGGGGAGQAYDRSYDELASNGAYGGGASGGSGGGGPSNTDYASGGSGGGGAGGSTDAGGGKAGMIWSNARLVCKGHDGSNHHTIPTDTTSENAEYGVTGNYGTGGTTATVGVGGFVLIKKA